MRGWAELARGDKSESETRDRGHEARKSAQERRGRLLSKDAMSGRSRSERRKVLYASHMMRSAITIAPAVLAIWTFSSLARVSREQGGGAEIIFGEDGSVIGAHHVGRDLLQVDSRDDRHDGLRDVLEQGRRPADPLLEL